MGLGSVKPTAHQPQSILAYDQIERRTLYHVKISRASEMPWNYLILVVRRCWVRCTSAKTEDRRLPTYHVSDGGLYALFAGVMIDLGLFLRPHLHILPLSMAVRFSGHDCSRRQ